MTDASKGLATEKEARDVAEEARETEWEHPSFARELFLGRFRADLINRTPQSTPRRRPGQAGLDKFRRSSPSRFSKIDRPERS